MTTWPINYKPMLAAPKKEKMGHRVKDLEYQGKRLGEDQHRIKRNQRWRKKDEQLKRTSQIKMVIYLLIIITLIYVIFFVKVL